MTSTILISSALSMSLTAGLTSRNSSPANRPDTRTPVTPMGISDSISIMGLPSFGQLCAIGTRSSADGQDWTLDVLLWLKAEDSDPHPLPKRQESAVEVHGS